MPVEIIMIMGDFLLKIHTYDNQSFVQVYTHAYTHAHTHAHR